MKRIMLLVDQEGINSNALDFACRIASLGASELTALYYNKQEFVASPIPVQPQSKKTDAHTCKADYCCSKCIGPSYMQFQSTCTKMGVSWKHNTGIFRHIDDLIKQTRFCDLLVFSAELNFNNDSDEYATGFSEQLIHRSGCPVLIAPLEPHELKTVVFACDNSASTAFATRQFVYLFGTSLNLPAEIFLVNMDQDGVNEELVSKTYNYLQLHLGSVKIRRVEGKPTEEILDELEKLNNAILVTGGFGRSELSYLLRPAVTGPLLRKMLLALFIAHV